MKKLSILLLLCFMMIPSMCGCTNSSSQPTVSNASNAIKTDGMVAENPSSIPTESSAKGSSDLVDLTALSSTMVYAEVYAMMTEPEDYLGRTIKMCGPYSVEFYEDTNQYYHYVLIEDATACCQQGLEFIWNGTHSYPDDYPKDGDPIALSGIFSSYEENGETFYYIATDGFTLV